MCRSACGHVADVVAVTVHAPLDPATAVKACSEAVVAPEPAALVAWVQVLPWESATLAVPDAPFHPTKATRTFPATTLDPKARACVLLEVLRCAEIA
jgi:hypothetical protein